MIIWTDVETTFKIVKVVKSPEKAISKRTVSQHNKTIYGKPVASIMINGGGEICKNESPKSKQNIGVHSYQWSAELLNQVTEINIQNAYDTISM